MGFKGSESPKNYDDLKKEIARWPRVGMHCAEQQNTEAEGTTSYAGMNSQKQTYTKTGFVRNPDLSHTYKGIDLDIDRLILEGYLVEFKNKDVQQETLKKKGGNTSILYPVNIDEDRDIEVRGTQSKYNQESLNILSELWNDTAGPQNKKDFNWDETILQNELLDEQEYHRYMYRRDMLNTFENEENDNAKKAAG